MLGLPIPNAEISDFQGSDSRFPMLGLSIPNAWIANPQCLDSRFPMLGLTIPNAWIPDSQGINAPCRGTVLAPRKGSKEEEQIAYVSIIIWLPSCGFNL